MTEHKLITLDDVVRATAKSGHSIFSPSASKLWLTCSGGLIPNTLADDETSREAAEGTTAHAVAEIWLRTGKRPKHLIGTIRTVDGWDIEIDAEMMAYVGDYVAWCQEIEEDAEEFLVETRIDFSDLTPIPNQGGTSDCIALIRKKSGKYRLVVRDLKYGKGVRVVAEENTQGMIYGYGAWKIYRDRFDIDEIEIGICHPRLADGTTTYTISLEQLLEFSDYVRERAHAAWVFDAPRTPSDAGCQWCRIKATCPALYQHISEVTSGVFDDDDDEYDAEDMDGVNERLEDDLSGAPLKFVNPRQLSTAALAKILRYRKVTEQFFASVEGELLDRAISREQEIPGWKIVEGRANRKWPDDWEAYLRLRKLGLSEQHIYEESIISPAEAEKRLHARAGLSKDAAAKLVNAIAIKPRGSKSLVRTSDKREALASDGSVFDDDEDVD